MARHSELMFTTGRSIAADLVTLLEATQKGAKFSDHRCKLDAANAVSYISNGDITELKRRVIHAKGMVIQARVEENAGKFGDAFALFGKALCAFAHSAKYAEALDFSREALEKAQDA